MERHYKIYETYSEHFSQYLIDFNIKDDISEMIQIDCISHTIQIENSVLGQNIRIYIVDVVGLDDIFEDCVNYTTYLTKINNYLKYLEYQNDTKK